MICTAILFLLLATAWIDILVNAGPGASSGIRASHGKSQRHPSESKPVKGKNKRDEDMTEADLEKQADKELDRYNEELQRMKM